MISHPLTVNIQGTPWHLYSADWMEPDRKCCFYFYAISDEHAHLVLQDIKDSAVMGGRVLGVVSND